MLNVVYLPLHGNRFVSIVCLRNFHVLKTFIKITYSPPSSRSLALSHGTYFWTRRSPRSIEVGPGESRAAPEGELLPPRHGERRDDEDGHRRGITPPLRQGAGMGLDWFSVATEASGSGTPDLLFSSKFLVYMDIYIYIGGRSTSVDLQAVHEVGGTPKGGGRAPTLVGSPGLSWSNSDTPWASSGPKISS